MDKLAIDEIELKGKRVFIRVDFNVPLENGRVTDETRIREAVPTIKYAAEKGAKVIVASHLGRPKGVTPEFTLKQVIEVFSRLLGKPVAFAEDCVGEKAESAVSALKDGEVLLLENVRFHKEEEKNDEEFSKKLARLADVYVNDAFGTAHRAHGSTEGITKFVKPAVAGFLMKKEIEYFNKSMTRPDHPLAVVLGGAKASTKLAVIEHLLDKCDIMVIGGGMAFTFLKAQGLEVGKNILEADMVEKVAGILAKAKQKGVKLYLPVDFVVAEKIEDGIPVELVTSQSLPPDKVAPDIGPATIALFNLALKPAKTIIWNGPMGVFEKKTFAAGTMAMARYIAGSGALTVVGGGDSVTAVEEAGLTAKMSFISTGGGAFLELLEGKTLPGLAALTDRG
ncbi:MAG: phosphoglycerate kinase [Nitrospinae bacterium]|nr:phosphoglycerate kinase [Nitrospinota bacterium]MBF0633332.1 phosphoglycerate kinase [Nitrospinota bacterium]